MISFKRFIKLFYTYVFTIEKSVKKKSNKEISRKYHIKYRLLLILALIPIMYAIFSAYHDYGFTLIGTFKLILLLFLIRIIGKELIDSIVHLLFYKSSYKISLKERRKLKMNKLNRFKYRIFKL